MLLNQMDIISVITENNVLQKRKKKVFLLSTHNDCLFKKYGKYIIYLSY